MKNRTLFVTSKQTSIQSRQDSMDMSPVMTVCMNMVLFSMHYDT